MFYIYILKSIEHIKFYTGYTNDLERRLKEHNAGYNTYPKRYKPWKIVYYEIKSSAIQAIKREKYFKSAAGRKWLKKHVSIMQ